MSIVGAFPSTIQNGTLEDATQVMALFAYIQSQVNGNACPATSTSSILKGNGAGGTAPAVAGTDYQAPIPPGTVFDYAGSALPAGGYLLCDGSPVSRTGQAALFAAIGTTWGAGDGATTFNVPDFRRRTLIGAGGAAVSGPANTLGAVGGEETHVLTTAELAAHNHTINISDPGHATTLNDPSHSHVYNAPGASQSNGGALGFAASPVATSTSAATTGITANTAFTGISASSVNAGSGSAHNNMQPSAVVNKIIKT